MFNSSLCFLLIHSLLRWLVLFSLLYAIFRAYRGFVKGLAFTKTDNSVRHWTATIAHIQLIAGMILYLQSPMTSYFWRNFSEAIRQVNTTFFGLVHISLMLIAIVVITVGSALAKRRQNDREKFKTMLSWFGIGLLIILIAVPWPFSPWASRPYLRTF
jgi:uncharacterized membrane protein